MNGSLYIVATPIGNLEDITLRALRILKEVDVVLCEDTRTTGKLLKHFDISAKLTSYHGNATDKKHTYILDMLRDGKKLALVSDAGTPCISDPGVMLIHAVRTQLPEVEIFAIPGPSAVISALSISGLPSSEYLFLGFAPHKKGRKTFFERIGASDTTIAFYESPHRFEKALAGLAEVLDENRHLLIARELTKMHEQGVYGTLFEILEYFKNHPDKIRGEFVIVVEGRK